MQPTMVPLLLTEAYSWPYKRFLLKLQHQKRERKLKIRLIMLRVLARIHLFIFAQRKYNIKMGIVEDNESIKDWS
jgi:hypothetical protein